MQIKIIIINKKLHDEENWKICQNRNMPISKWEITEIE